LTLEEAVKEASPKDIELISDLLKSQKIGIKLKEYPSKIF
jgi:hypothetical protein